MRIPSVVIVCSSLCLVFFFTACGLPISDETPLQKRVPKTAVYGLFAKDKSSLDLLSNSPQFISLLDAKSSSKSLSFLNEELLDRVSFNGLSSSWHSIGKEQMAALFIVEVGSNESTSLNQSFVTAFQISGGYEERIYNDITIYTGMANGAAMSWVIDDTFLAFSTQSILLEDFIRSSSDENYRLELAEPKNGTVSFYLNNARMDEAFDFANANVFSTVWLNGTTQLELEITSNEVLFNGFSNANNNLNKRNSAIRGLNYIPNGYLSIKWLGTPADSPLESVVNNFATVDLSVYNQQEKVYLLPVENSAQVKAFLSASSEQNLAISDSLTYQESFAGEQIQYVQDSVFSSFDSDESLQKGAFYSLIDNLLIFSTSAEAIRQCLSSHADELTIGQSVEDRRFFDALVQDTYFTQVINVSNQDEVVWSTTLDKLVFQANAASSGLLIDGEVSFLGQKRPLETSSGNGQVLIANAYLDTTAISKAFVVTNHLNSEKELVVQDANYQLYQLSNEGEVNWKTTMSSALVSDVLQVDYYNNRKLQYLFLTDSLVHIIDRNGDEIEGFPKAHGVQGKISSLSLIDYDNTKRYRYLIQAGRGDLYLFDKEVKPLEGWEPNALNANLQQVPYHERIAGKDFYLVAERSNQISLLNRRGGTYTGFPFNADMRFSGEVFLKRSPSFATTEIVAISDRGKLVKVNLLGRQTSSEQLFRENEQTDFELVGDVLGNGYVVLVRENGKTKVLDEDNQTIFELFEKLPNQNQVSYYRFNNGASVLLSWNPQNGGVELFNMNGETLINDLYSAYKPSILYYSKKGVYQLFVNLGNEVNLYEITSSTK